MKKAKSNSGPVENNSNTSSRRNIVRTAAGGSLLLGLMGLSGATLADDMDSGRLCGTPQGVRKFFNALLDQKSRAMIEKEPKRSLASYGIKVPDGFLEAHPDLPSVENVRNLLQQMDKRPRIVQMQIDSHHAFFAFFAFLL